MPAGADKAEHYATGIIFVLVGVFGVIGSITGTLPSMIAALWIPGALYSTNSTGNAGTSGATTPGGKSGIQEAASAATTAHKILEGIGISPTNPLGLGL